ncbi:MAG TPA: histidinol dehydrogenase [Woeseiaceae bacterium]|nr:histidinol dehydrogenase [Woeseiaceae bacterium]
MPIERAQWNALDAAARRSFLRRPAVEDDAAIRTAVLDIVRDVKNRGDDALHALTARLDGVELDDLRVSPQEMDAAKASLPPQAIDAIDVAISNVRRFHEAQMRPDVMVETMPGVRCERVSRPIDAVGLYVPAGTAPLPSAAVMLAVPAVIAGCSTTIVCTPPRPDGRADPAVVVASARAGVTDIFKIGGAQAVAAMAYGTGSVPKVDKIFGPGNAWVTCAKSVVSADPDGAAIDMPAGPSEVLVIADDTASPEFVASDLLSQAEHGVDSQVVLVTTSEQLADAVERQIEEQLETLSRAEIARGSLEHARAVIVDSLDTAVTVSNQYAPEHLILQCRDARGLVAAISNAGSVFVGEWTPESVGDYCSGTNHVLPTYGYARSYSGLSLDQFMRGMTVQELSRDGLVSLSEAVVTLAGLEGLDAHASAVTRRLRAES